MNLSPVLRQRFLDNNGAPLAGGKLYSYVAGTTTPLATCSNSTGTANANPVVLDGNGYADIWLDPTLSYKMILKDASDATVWSVDNISYVVGTTALNWSANTTYSQGGLASDSSGQGLLYVSLIDSNQNRALTDVSAWRVFGGNVRTVSTSGTLLVTDNFIRSNSTSGNVTLTMPTAATTPIGKTITVVDVGSGGNTTTANSLALSNTTGATFLNNGASWDAVSGYGIPVSSIGTQMLGSKVVTAAKIADTTITAAQISNNTITGTQIASSINLPGNAVQENGKNVVVSNTNASTSLCIIRGWVNALGTVTAGEGFTVNRTASGQYQIAFSAAFASQPAVTISPVNNSVSVTAVLVSTISASEQDVHTYDSTSGVYVDSDFMFIAIGPR